MDSIHRDVLSFILAHVEFEAALSRFNFMVKLAFCSTGVVSGVGHWGKNWFTEIPNPTRSSG